MILDELIYKEILAVKDSAIENYNSIEADVKKWMKQKNNVGNKLQKLNNELNNERKIRKISYLNELEIMITLKYIQKCLKPVKMIYNR